MKAEQKKKAKTGPWMFCQSTHGSKGHRSSSQEVKSPERCPYFFIPIPIKIDPKTCCHVVLIGDAVEEEKLDAPTILNTFEEDYREALQGLPAELFPQSCKHGKHSYTLQHGQHSVLNRV